MQIHKIIPLLGCFALLCLAHCTNKSEGISQNDCENFPQLNKADSMVRADRLQNKPWIICNANQLKLIQSLTSSVYDVQDEYILARNIDFGGKDVTPIDNFIGTFDGNGRTISNFTIVSETPTIGFFQQIGSASASGRVINLVIAQATIKVTSSTATIYAGILAGRLQHKDSVISDVTISSGSVSGDTTSTHAHYLGGLIGHADNGTIINGSAHISVVNGGFEFDRMGGLVGQSEGSATIDNSTATGNVSNGDAGADFMGGLVGETGGTSMVQNSIATGNVSHGDVGDDRMGGLVGLTYGQSKIDNSTATGNVSNGGADSDRMGGLVGFTYGQSKIDNSSATGNVSNGGAGSDRMGGLVGEFREKSNIRRSIASGDVFSGGVDIDVMGGLIGLQQNSQNKFEDCIATGDVELGDGTETATELDSCGMNNGYVCGTKNALGGLVGYVPGCSARAGGTGAMQLRSYALGNVKSSGDSLGGVFGCFTSSVLTNITDLYWNSQTSGLSSTAIGNSNQTCSSTDGCTSHVTFQLISATNLPNFNSSTWNYGNNAEYPGLIFTSTMGQTCTVRPIVTSGSDTKTSAEFTICPVQVNVDSFHPMCRAKPLGCP